MKTMLALLLLIPCLALTVLLDVIPAVMKATATPVHPDPASVVASGEAPDARFVAAAERASVLARTLVAGGNLPGLSVAVGVDGQLAWASGFGWADIEQRRPATPDTLYRLGLASQPLTAAGVGVLVQQGRLDLDAPVQRHVPGFPLKAAAVDVALDLPGALYSLLPERTGARQTVSTRQAMAHTAGFRSFRFEDDFMPHQHCGHLLEGLQLFADDPLEFKPGTDQDYSPYGWILASAVVEAAAGLPFDRYMDQAVLQPLGMRATRLDDGRRMPQRAPFYWPRANQDTSYGLEHPDGVDLSCFAGAYQYLSTPSDLVRLGLAMDHGRLLDAATTAMLETPVRLPSGKSAGFALGWRVGQVPFGDGETLRLDHPGFAVGAMTVLQRYPQQGVVVAVSTNVTFVELEPFAREVAEVFAAAQADPARARQ